MTVRLLVLIIIIIFTEGLCNADINVVTNYSIQTHSASDMLNPSKLVIK